MYFGIVDGLKKIYKEDGWRGYFRGLGASLMGLSHVAVYFPLYEGMKDVMRVKRMG